MVKKLKPDALMIKELLSKGYRQCEISRLLKIKKEKVSYWSRHELRTSQNKKKKLKDIYINAIQRWANNKVTSAMSSRTIANKINLLLIKKKEFDKKGKQLSVHFTTVNHYLKQYFGKPRKLRRVFYLNEDNKNARVKFCNYILEKKIRPEQIFFTDESKIDLSSFTNDSIRLDPKIEWNEDTYNLLNRQQKKFELSLTIAAGINYYGTSKLIFLEGTMNQFAYGQALLFYKDDIKEIEERENVKLIFEQDGATCHTSKANKYLLNKLFHDNWIQNPPNSPDLASPIENIWGIIKPRVKRRNPQSIEELKEFLLEEWGSIPKEMVKNLCKGYLDKIKKIRQLNGGRIEKKFRDNEKNKLVYKWERPSNIQNQRVVYNDSNLLVHRQKEMKRLRQKIGQIKKRFSKKRSKLQKTLKKRKFKKRDLKNLSIGRGLSIIESSEKAKEEKVKCDEQKNKLVKEVEDQIEKISKMDVFEYLRYKNGEDDGKEENSMSTKDEVEEKVDNLEQLIKNKEIKYKNLKF